MSYKVEYQSPGSLEEDEARNAWFPSIEVYTSKEVTENKKLHTYFHLHMQLLIE